MTYNNTPLANQTPAASQPQMQQNFLQIATSYNTDHVALNSGSNVGQHKQVTFQNAFNVPPGPQGDPNKVSPITSLYTKSVSGPLQLFFQNDSMAANVVQITGNATLSGSEYTVISPWGLTFKYGFGTASPTGTANTFATNFPTTVIGIVITVRANGPQSSAAVITGANNYTAYCQSGTQTIYFMAWGT